MGQRGDRVRPMHSTWKKTRPIYLQNVLLAFFYFVLQLLKLLRVEGWVCFAIGFS